VGIGTNTPDSHLVLEGEDNLAVLLKLDQKGSRAWTGLRLDRASVEEWFIGMDYITDKLLIRRKANSNEVIINESGNLGIGRDATSHRLEVAGDALKTSGGNTWQTSSDRRLKDIHGPYIRGLDAVLHLNPVTFRYKAGNPRDLPSDVDEIGFAAQEVRDVFPEAVSRGPDGYLNFNIHPVQMAIVNAIKELKAENEALRAQNWQLKTNLEEKIDELRTMIQELKG
jgi:hypothetical protein